jgi:hypothetical protein
MVPAPRTATRRIGFIGLSENGPVGEFTAPRHVKENRGLIKVTGDTNCGAQELDRRIPSNFVSISYLFTHFSQKK